MPACKGRSGHHARPSCFPPFGGGIIKSTEHTATPWLRAKPEDQQGKSGEKPALALDFLQAVSVERMRTKGAFCPVIGKPRRLTQPRRHGQISPRRIRKPEDLRTFYSPRKMRAQNIILMCIIRGSFEFFTELPLHFFYKSALRKGIIWNTGRRCARGILRRCIRPYAWRISRRR